MKKRSTIGFLLDFFAEKYQADILSGLAAEAEKADLNLITFVGGAINNPEVHHLPRNYIYNLVSARRLEGLIISTGTIGNFVDQDSIAAFCNRFSPLPVVSIGREIAGKTSIMVDSTTGFSDLISHMVTKHQAGRIALIRGPDNNPEAEVRFQVYKNVLQEYNLSFDPALVTYGDFYIGSGNKAVATLLDERKVSPDVIIASNDLMAIDTVKELQHRGHSVPDDIAVTGFDDIEVSKYLDPPLSTVRQPLPEIGQAAVRAIQELLAGGDVPGKIILPSEKIIRKSCGCRSSKQSPFIILHDRDSNNREHKINEELICSELFFIVKNFIRMHMDIADIDVYLIRLLKSLCNEVNSQEKGTFCKTLEAMIIETSARKIDICVWNNLVTYMLYKIVPYLNTPAAFRLIEDLWNQSMYTIWEHVKKQHSKILIDTNQRVRASHIITIEMITNFDLEKLKKVIIRELPVIGLNQCFLCEYHDSEIKQEARLLLAYDQKKLDPDPAWFPAVDLLPDNLLDPDRRMALFVMALYFQQQHLGYVIFNMAPLEGIIYEDLAIQISGVLKGSKLMQLEQRYLEEQKKS